ncbi:MAG: hypothetical protein Q9218_003769 [Villophora microphyllina]
MCMGTDDDFQASAEILDPVGYTDVDKLAIIEGYIADPPLFDSVIMDVQPTVVVNKFGENLTSSNALMLQKSI